MILLFPSGSDVRFPRLLIFLIFTPLKAFTPREVRLGRERSAISREVQPLKALASIEVRDDGKFALTRVEQPWNALAPMLVSVSEKFTSASAVQP